MKSCHPFVVTLINLVSTISASRNTECLAKNCYSNDFTGIDENRVIKTNEHNKSRCVTVKRNSHHKLERGMRVLLNECEIGDFNEVTHEFEVFMNQMWRFNRTTGRICNYDSLSSVFCLSANPFRQRLEMPIKLAPVRERRSKEQVFAYGALGMAKMLFDNKI